MKSHHLAEAVAAGHVRVDTEAFEQGELGQGNGSDSRLGVLHLGEALSLLAEFDLVEGGGWEGEAVQLQRACLSVASGHIPSRAGRGEGHGEI